MRVAVIAPPYPLEEAPAPPLGVCYVAAAFEAAGCEVAIFDFVVSEYSKAKLARLMEDFKPDVVGSTSVTLNFKSAAQIVCDAKEINPSVLTMMGGPHVSFYAKETLAQYPGVDMILRGEGEQTIAELVPRIKDRSSWPEIKGITWRDGDGFAETGQRDFIKDLNTLPFPSRHLLPLSRYKALGFPISIITSRGCPYQCIFCLGRRMVGAKVRYRDAVLVVDEIEHLLSLGFSRINVADDLFASNKERVAAVCGEIRRRGLKFGWSAFARVNTVDEEVVRTMKDAGCDCIAFGIESGNADMLKLVKKSITKEQVLKAKEVCEKVGMSVHGSFIAGLPGETAETLAETEKFANGLKFLHGYHYLAPFPGTTLYEDRDKYDIEILTYDWNLYDANRPVTRTPGASPEDIIAFVKRFEAECDEEWAKLEKGYLDGTNTPLENLRVEGNRKLPVSFRVIAGDMIDSCGALPEGSAISVEDALKILADRVTAQTGFDPALVMKVLSDFRRGGHISIMEKADKSRAWGWTPNPAHAKKTA